jgi:hypothetical protein
MVDRVSGGEGLVSVAPSTTAAQLLLQHRLRGAPRRSPPLPSSAHGVFTSNPPVGQAFSFSGEATPSRRKGVAFFLPGESPVSTPTATSSQQTLDAAISKSEADILERAFLLAFAWTVAGDLVRAKDMQAVDAYLRALGAPLPGGPGWNKSGSSTPSAIQCGEMAPEAAVAMLALSGRYGDVVHTVSKVSASEPADSKLQELAESVAPESVDVAHQSVWHLAWAAQGGLWCGKAPSVFDLCLEASPSARWDLWARQCVPPTLPRHLASMAPGVASSVNGSTLLVPTVRQMACAGIVSLYQSLGVPVLLVGPSDSGKATIAELALSQITGVGRSVFGMVDFSEAEALLSGRLTAGHHHNAGDATPTGRSSRRSRTSEAPSPDDLSPREEIPSPRPGAEDEKPVLSAAAAAAATGEGKASDSEEEDSEADHSVSYSAQNYLFTAATTRSSAQAVFESFLERRGGKTYGPPGGSAAVMTLVMEDLSRPACDDWGCRTALEVLRHLMSTGTLPYLSPERRGEWKQVIGMRFMGTVRTSAAGDTRASLIGSTATRVMQTFGPAAAASAPGSGGGLEDGGANYAATLLATGQQSPSSLVPGGFSGSDASVPSGMPLRLLRLFASVPVLPPSVAEMTTIFGSMLAARFSPSEPSLHGLHLESSSHFREVLHGTLPKEAAIAAGIRCGWASNLLRVPPLSPTELPTSKTKGLDDNFRLLVRESIHADAEQSEVAYVAGAMAVATACTLAWCNAELPLTPSRITGGVGLSQGLRALAGVCRMPFASSSSVAVHGEEEHALSAKLAFMWRHEMEREVRDRFHVSNEQLSVVRVLANSLNLGFEALGSIASELSLASHEMVHARSPSLPWAAVLTASLDSASWAFWRHEHVVDTVGIDAVQQAVLTAPEDGHVDLVRSTSLANQRVQDAFWRLTQGKKQATITSVQSALGASDVEARTMIAFGFDSEDYLAADWVSRSEDFAAEALGGDFDASSHGSEDPFTAPVTVHVGYSLVPRVALPEEEAATVYPSGELSQTAVAELLAEHSARRAGTSSVGRASEALQSLLTLHNTERPRMSVQAVLFPEAVRLVTAVARAIGTYDCHTILVGNAGSGRRTIAKLAAIAAGADLLMDSAGDTFATVSVGEAAEGGGDSSSKPSSSVASRLADAVRIASSGKRVVFVLCDSDVEADTDSGARAVLHAVASLVSRADPSPLFSKDEMQILLSALAPTANRLALAFTANRRSRASTRARSLSDAGSPAKPTLGTGGNLALQLLKHRVKSHLTLVVTLSPSNSLADRVFAGSVRPSGNSLSALFQAFPSLVSRMVVSSVPRWPREALARLAMSQLDLISTGDDYDDTSFPPATRQAVAWHLATAHTLALDQAPARVAHTPRTFLALVSGFISIFCVHGSAMASRETKFRQGVLRLDDGAKDIESMRLILQESEKNLRRSEEAVARAMDKLREQSAEAEAERAVVQELRETLRQEAEYTLVQKEEADRQLAAALPYFERAKAAVEAISSSDIVELKGMQNPKPAVKLVMDAVLITLGLPVDRVVATTQGLGSGREKLSVQFLADSFANAKRGALADVGFLKNLLRFGEEKRDDITDETEELLEPYLHLPGLTSLGAVSRAAEGLMLWVRALIDYKRSSKEVRPKLEALRIAEAALRQAQSRVDQATEKLRACDATLAELQSAFESRVQERENLEKQASNARRRIRVAESLLAGLAGERQRWLLEADKIVAERALLAGDAALAAGVTAYIGPLSLQDRILFLVGPNGTLVDLLSRGLRVNAELLPPHVKATLRREYIDEDTRLTPKMRAVRAAKAIIALDPVHYIRQPLPVSLAAFLLDDLNELQPGWHAASLPSNSHAVLSAALSEWTQREALFALTGNSEAPLAAARRSKTLKGHESHEVIPSKFEAPGRSFVGRIPLLLDPQGQAFRWIRRTLDRSLAAENAVRLHEASAAVAEARKREQKGLAPLRAHAAAQQLLLAAESSGGVVPGLEPVQVIPASSSKLLDAVTLCMQQGRPILVSELDGGSAASGGGANAPPALLPILEGRVSGVGKRLQVSLGGGRMVEISPGFSLHLIASGGRTTLSAGLQGLCCCISFGVSPEGLEEQLLSRILAVEQASAEERLAALELESAAGRVELMVLQDEVLLRLASSTGNLLEDDSLMNVLKDTKKTADAVASRLEEAEATRERLAERREAYRPAAERGTLLFFAWHSMSSMHPFYGVSLEKFLLLHDAAMEQSASSVSMQRRTHSLVDSAAAAAAATATLTSDEEPDASIPPGAVGLLGEASGLASAPATIGSSARRVQSIIHALTSLTVQRASRAMKHHQRLAFRLDIALRMLEAAALVAPAVRRVLISGASDSVSDAHELTISGVARPAWTSPTTWRGVHALTTTPALSASFSAFLSSLTQEEPSWRTWASSSAPELSDPPHWPGCHQVVSSSASAGAGAYGSLARSKMLWQLEKLLLIRVFRPDRLDSATPQFLRSLRWLPPAPASVVAASATRITTPGMGPGLEMSAQDGISVSALADEAGPTVPVLLLLSQGADAASAVEAAAAKSRIPVMQLSLGGGHDLAVLRSVKKAVQAGAWVVLQNAELGREAVEALTRVYKNASTVPIVDGLSVEIQLLGGAGSAEGVTFEDEAIEGDASAASAAASSKSKAALWSQEDAMERLNPTAQFRLFVTMSRDQCDSHGEELARLSVLAALEEPVSLRSAMVRATTSGALSQDLLDRIEGQEWKRLCWALSYLHSACQARKAYGSLGWTQRYGFDDADLMSCFTFAERHLSSLNGHPISIGALQYMVSQVLVGGRVTDSSDRRLLEALSERWICLASLQPGFCFGPAEGDHIAAQAEGRSPLLARTRHERRAIASAALARGVPEYQLFVYDTIDADSIADFRSKASGMPMLESPEAVGLHPVAGGLVTAQKSNDLVQVLASLSSSVSSSPLRAGPAGTTVMLGPAIDKLPAPLAFDDLSSALRMFGGPEKPLLAFAVAEAMRLSALEGAARVTLCSVDEALNQRLGAVPPTLEAAAAEIAAGRTPRVLLDAAENVASPGSGEWLNGHSLASWLAGLTDRSTQIRAWLRSGLPKSIWLGGLLSPRAFATAVRQDAFRNAPGMKGRVLSVDSLVLYGQVTTIPDEKSISTPPVPGEGVFVHGLVIQGAEWADEGLAEISLRTQTLQEELPVVSLSAIPEQEARRATARAGPVAPLECPVYASPLRGDECRVCSILIPTREQRAEHWIIRGVAVLLRPPSTV